MLVNQITNNNPVKIKFKPFTTGTKQNPNTAANLAKIHIFYFYVKSSQYFQFNVSFRNHGHKASKSGVWNSRSVDQYIESDAFFTIHMTSNSPQKLFISIHSLAPGGVQLNNVVGWDVAQCIGQQIG